MTLSQMMSEIKKLTTQMSTMQRDINEIKRIQSNCNSVCDQSKNGLNSVEKSSSSDTTFRTDSDEIRSAGKKCNDK